MTERFVLDTNTVISGIFWPDSFPGQAINKALRHQVLISPEIEREFWEVLARPKFDKLKHASERFAALESFLSKCQKLEVLLVVQACRDPKDDMFLALAKFGNATLIVSGDKDLVEMNPWEGIPILTPRQFIEADE
jgi:putative PIN family toxin of toxin-antitoxin system